MGRNQAVSQTGLLSGALGKNLLSSLCRFNARASCPSSCQSGVSLSRQSTCLVTWHSPSSSQPQCLNSDWVIYILRSIHLDLTYILKISGWQAVPRSSLDENLEGRLQNSASWTFRLFSFFHS